MGLPVLAYTAKYTASELGDMAIDIVGGLLNGLAENAGTIGKLIVIVLIIVLVVDLLTGVFGIFSFIRGVGRR